MVAQVSKKLHAAQVRLGLAFLLSFLLLLPVATVYAAGNANGCVTPTNDDLCVKGIVIDHQEKRLGDGRIVTATAADGTAMAAAVDEDGAFEFENGLFPGRWTFAIDVLKAGEEWEPVTPASFDVTLDYSQSDCYLIRFKLRRVVTVIVVKIDENHNRLADWEIKAEPGADNRFAVSHTATTDANGEAVFRLSEGKWIFTEYAPEDVNYVPVVPTNGRQELTVEGPGPQTIRFKNRLNIYGCIDVLKQDVPPVDSSDTPFPLQGWKINLLRADGTLAASGATNALGTISFEKLPYGPYTVVEEERVGWESATVTSYDVTLAPDQSGCTEVVFDNQQAEPQYCIEGRKIDTFGKVGIPGWKITAQPLDKGDWDPADQVTDGFGMFKFTFSGNDYRVPGSRYKICEDFEDVTGWQPLGPTCYTVTLPSQPGACLVVPDFVNQQVGHGSASAAPTSSSGCRVTHTVKHGDSLYGIGYKYGVAPKAMVAANPWISSQPQMHLKVGQAVCIP